MLRPTEQPRRVLPADFFDAMELSALAYGGIGAGRWYSFKAGKPVAPLCAFGHARDLHVDGESALRNASLDELTNDMCVLAVSSHKRTRNGRIGFPDWCRWLNVHRGQ